MCNPPAVGPARRSTTARTPATLLELCWPIVLGRNSSVVSSKTEPGRHGKLPHAANRRNPAKRWRCDGRINRRVIRDVENVGGLRPKFQHSRLFQRDDFGEGHIKDLASRTNDAVAAGIAV